MRNRKPTIRGGSMVEFSMLIPIWLPLLIGTQWIGSSMVRGQQVTQMARDLASMYSRGVNFSTTGSTASNATLDQITQQLGTMTPTGTGVVIFSTITYAGNSFCFGAGSPTYGSLSGTTYSHTGSCSNYGDFVFTQQYTQGNTSLLASNFGKPLSADMDANFDISAVSSVTHSGDKSSFNLISPVPQENGQDGYQSGQPIYVVEVFFQSTGLAGYTKGGDYAYAVF